MTTAAILSQEHPIVKSILADVKRVYEARQRNADGPRSLHEFLVKHDLGNGEVRMEDFRAGFSLGGVSLTPYQVSSMKGTYGTPEGHIRYIEILDALDLMGYQSSINIVMNNKMGSTTAKHVGYGEGIQGPEGYLGCNNSISIKTSPGQLKTNEFLTTSSMSPNSLMRTSHITAVATGSPEGGVKAAFNHTAIVTGALTKRHKSTVAVETPQVVARISAATGHDGHDGNTSLAAELQALDPTATGCVALDAFLSACAKAGVTLRPDELDALRLSGHLRRPYSDAPELVDFMALELV